LSVIRGVPDIPTYDGLCTFVGLYPIRRFARGHFHLVILIGSAGLAKSRTARRVLGDNVCWIEDNATPFGMYAKLYKHRDQFVVIDDVDALYADRSGVRLLKCLCQTEPDKGLAWRTDARSLERQGIPREFMTRSPVLIIGNDWRTLNKNLAALQDRGHVLVFQPSAAEVHQKAGGWFTDQEIYEWLGQNLHRVREPSLRLYERAAELTAAGLDWTEVLVAKPNNPRDCLAAELLASPAHRGNMLERGPSWPRAADAEPPPSTTAAWPVVRLRIGPEGRGRWSPG
jgi:hypothetical protein